MPFILSAAVFFFGILPPIRRLLSQRRLPPGPKGWPIIGNVFDIPQQYKWVKYTEWAHKYGPLVHLNVGGLPILVLNTQRVAVDLLGKRGAIYSGRPRSVMCSEVVGEYIMKKSLNCILILW